jgi:hypothetical protein
MRLQILFDQVQEGQWFQGLHGSLTGAPTSGFPNASEAPPSVRQVLAYDRPDIILTDEDSPILVLERTTEVPTGHNVGQRFARLVAAAQLHIPTVYFGPYKAYKHGGSTQGVRYMNLRLFEAISNLARIESAYVTTINWPVDNRDELLKDPSKDGRLRDFLQIFFELYQQGPVRQGFVDELQNCEFERAQEAERQDFARSLRRRDAYEEPPDTVRIGPADSFIDISKFPGGSAFRREIVLYDIGMRYIRSDPYSGMALLYSYLYCDGLTNRSRDLILHFPEIDYATWQRTASTSVTRKDVRLFRLVADAILFSDRLVLKADL